MTKKEFLELLERYEKGQASEADKLLFDQFFNAFQKGELEDWDFSTAERIRLEIKKNVQQAMGQAPKRMPIWQHPSFRVAASLIFAICTFYFVYDYAVDHSEPKNYITKTVPFGEQQTLRLADGSVVRLNAGSSLTYPEAFQDDLREVSLVGEAFFEIQPNKKAPFIVMSNGLETKVLGTSFNINAHDEEEITVTLVEGKVAVSTPEDEDLLTPGQQITYDITTKGLTKTDVDTKKELAWLDGVLYFENTPLDEVMATLSRWYDTDITFSNEQLTQCNISGKFSEDELVNVLEGLRFLVNIDYEISESKKIVITGEGCQ